LLKRDVVTQARRAAEAAVRLQEIGGKQMKPFRLATLGIIAAGAMFGALAASAAPMTSLGTLAGSNNSAVTPVHYCGWWCRHHHHHHHYYRHHRRYYY
jgi:anti-sigma factor RsiW